MESFLREEYSILFWVFSISAISLSGLKIKLPNGTEYYEYMLLYVDDALCINHNAKAELYKLDKYFKMKEDSNGDPDIYLGGKITSVSIDSGGKGPDKKAWALFPTKYVQAAIANDIEEYLVSKNYNGRKLPRKHAKAPFANGYQPELDLTNELNDTDSTYYQSQIGILRWMVELGRVDIISIYPTCKANDCTNKRTLYFIPWWRKVSTHDIFCATACAFSKVAIRFYIH